ncbi:transport protein, putative [Pyrobaculum aerophilum str. IM2]|uniref:Transport protein, putative n=2 Tax=Pyrobaculum aerophilum TaxID=13773 RepID=Q8ZUN3_PYRAE|nr:ABC transporter permease [Pyrobaculum aerophilum]AAL64374.1 transport protein, putative [Pyrobaculum aerophilum str. IM2]HII46777.1 ABC transporter permease [Pyrobaculum aerophilum]
MVIPLLAALVIISAFLLGFHQVNWSRAMSNLITWISEGGFNTDVVAEGLYALLDTMYISAFATAAGTLIAFPLAALSTPSIAPAPIASVMRMFTSLIRTVPSLLYAVIGVIMVGPGPVAGALALTIYTTGYLAKLFYETFENVDKEFLDVMRTFTHSLPLLAHLVYLKLRKQFITNIMFIFEYNLRTAAVIGFVGAGGIGYYISQYISLLRYDAVFTLVLLTFLFVGVIDIISYIFRKKVLKG